MGKQSIYFYEQPKSGQYCGCVVLREYQECVKMILSQNGVEERCLGMCTRRNAAAAAEEIIKLGCGQQKKALFCAGGVRNECVRLASVIPRQRRPLYGQSLGGAA